MEEIHGEEDEAQGIKVNWPNNKIEEAKEHHLDEDALDIVEAKTLTLMFWWCHMIMMFWYLMEIHFSSLIQYKNPRIQDTTSRRSLVF